MKELKIWPLTEVERKYTYTVVGNNLYHICEFAEVMQRCGNSYEPVQEKSRKQEQPEMAR